MFTRGITSLLLAISLTALAACGGDKGIQTDNCGKSCSDNTQCRSSELECVGGSCRPLECQNCTSGQTCQWDTSSSGGKTYCEFEKCE